MFSVTKLTSAAPEAPFVLANLYLAMSEDRYASKTAPEGESSWFSLWRHVRHFSCLLQPLRKKCDAGASL